MAKQQSFAEKAAKKNKKDLSTYVKYIKSVKSDKTGYWRFNEQMIEVKEGENLDGALKRIDEVTQVFDIENPVVEAATDVETVEKDRVNDPKDYKQAADDNGQEELADIVAKESAIETNEPATEEQEKPEPETDETATTENDQESGATEGEEAAVEKENDADETVEPSPEDVGTVTEEQAEDAGASGKDMQTNADESA
ncbi:MAG: DUF4295 family protein [Candidatus Neomarinimicrobiota bacterium]